jgi:hypothetical protein
VLLLSKGEGGIGKTATSEDEAGTFISHIYQHLQHHGMPKILISDGDTRLISKFWTDPC